MWTSTLKRLVTRSNLLTYERKTFFTILPRQQQFITAMMPIQLNKALIALPSRSFMMLNKYSGMQNPGIVGSGVLAQQNTASITQVERKDFSLKMRKVRAKGLLKKRVKKYKLKTVKGAQKRFRVVGGLADRAFKYHAVGHRHLNRNKSHRNLKAAKRRHTLTHLADHKKMKKMLPYFKRRKALSS